MINGGPVARNGFRYQDFCVIDLLLGYYLQKENFESLYCERGKLDFEFHFLEKYNAYQAKNKNKKDENIHISASYVNQLLKEFQAQANNLSKQISEITFILSDEPNPALKLLIDKIALRQVKIEDKNIQKYHKDALKDINISEFKLRILICDNVESSALGKANEILKNHYKNGEYLPSTASWLLLSGIRDIVEQISCEADCDSRFKIAEELISEIKRVILSINVQNDNGPGRPKTIKPYKISKREGVVKLRYETVPKKIIIEMSKGEGYEFRAS